jgi:hypothetical protein
MTAGRLFPNLDFHDTVGVFTSDFNQVFRAARIVDADVDEPAMLMEHPLETGATVTDHRIIKQVKIELSIVLQSRDYKNVYEEIKRIFLAGDLLSVQTRATVYTNQVIAELPHREDPQVYDALTVGLKFKQILFANAKFNVTPKSPSDSDTVTRGQVQPQIGRNSTAANGVAP